jgi:hypothetical protein
MKRLLVSIALVSLAACKEDEDKNDHFDIYDVRCKGGPTYEKVDAATTPSGNIYVWQGGKRIASILPNSECAISPHKSGL